jgi:hypothetical protein
MAGVVAQVLECLPVRRKTLSSSLRTAKKKQKQKTKTKRKQKKQNKSCHPSSSHHLEAKSQVLTMAIRTQGDRALGLLQALFSNLLVCFSGGHRLKLLSLNALTSFLFPTARPSALILT